MDSSRQSRLCALAVGRRVVCGGAPRMLSRLLHGAPSHTTRHPVPMQRVPVPILLAAVIAMAELSSPAGVGVVGDGVDRLESLSTPRSVAVQAVP